MKIVIIGGGFGGIKAALELQKDRSFDVTLISDKPNFVYYPALYATATGGSRRQSDIPLSDIFKGTRVNVVHDELVSLDTQRKYAVGKNGQYPYAHAILALGVVTNYFGISGLEQYSYSIKSPADVARFKTHLHDELTTTKHLDKHYLVVGAGPTGVELSSSLGQYIADIASNHKIGHAKINIELIEAAPRVLPKMSESTSRLVAERLKSLGVKLMVGKAVKGEDSDSLNVGGKDILSKTVVWTSGVSNHPFYAAHADLFKLAKNGRVEVDEHLETHKHIYVIGDNANTPYTGLAQTALHDAIFISHYLGAVQHERPLPRYKAVKPPVVIPVGPNWAVMEWGPVRLSGWVASLVRRFADLIGYHDIMPLGLALGTWRSQEKSEPEPDCAICGHHALT